MQKYSFWALALIASLFIIPACDHNHEEEDDVNNPVITISSPVTDAAISGAVIIAGLVTDESLHEMSIIVTQDSDGTELFKSTPEVHDLTSYTIAETWTPAGISAETPVTLTVTAEDHGSNKVVQTVHFKVKP